MKKLFSVLCLLAATVIAYAKPDLLSHFNFLVENSAAVFTAAVFPLGVSAEAYRKFYKEIASAASTQGFIAAPGDLRSETLISNTTSLYQFPIRDTTMNKTTFPASQGVQDNDLFISYALGLFWDTRTAGQSDIELQSYPNNTVAVAGGITPKELFVFYNGQLSVQVGSTEFIKQLNSNTFLTQPRTQQTSATNHSEFDLAAMLKNVGAFPIFSGKADNKVTLAINTAGVTDVVGTGQAVLTFWAKGIVINNGANDENLRVAVLQALGRL